MVDAVVTWVDGSDPLHKEKHDRYANKAINNWTHPRAKHPTRFADKNEIWYCVHSIRKFAPYIDKIFMVTDNQQPEWLTDEIKQTLNVQVVDHAVIFSGYQQYLPTFNSLTIESMLHRIPGISDRFLYFNDDVILINPTKKEDYFDRDQLIYRGDWQWKRKLKQRLARFMPLSEIFKARWADRGYLGKGNENGYFQKNWYQLFRLVHAPYPLNKTIFDQLFISNKELEKQIQYRFKNKQQYIPASLAANQALLKGAARKGPHDYGYLSCNDLTLEQAEKWLDYFEKNSFIKSLCIQSLDQASPEVETRIKSFLNNRLAV